MNSPHVNSGQHFPSRILTTALNPALHSELISLHVLIWHSVMIENMLVMHYNAINDVRSLKTHICTYGM